MRNSISFIDMKVISTKHYPEVIIHDKRIMQRCEIIVYKKWPYRSKSKTPITLVAWGDIANRCHEDIYKGSVISCIVSHSVRSCRVMYEGKPLKDKKDNYVTTQRIILTIIELL